MNRSYIVLVILLVMLSACHNRQGDLLIYQEAKTLSISNHGEVLNQWTDVIDYSYDSDSRVIFVLHEARSNHVDSVGYEGAKAEGLEVGGFIRVYQLDFAPKLEVVMIYENDFTWVNPWSLDCGDFEGDGLIELFVGCYRATEVYPADRRPFVVMWDGEKIVKKWTGSYIGVDSFSTGHIEDMNDDGKDELVLLKVMDDGSLRESIYRWGTFTFDLVSEKTRMQ